jgi:hypothetical protein
MTVLRSAILAMVMAAAGAAHSQPVRPSPELFKSGECKAAACARDKWLAFLKEHDQSELAPAPGAQMRLIILNAEPCRAKKNTVEFRSYELGASPKAKVLICGEPQSKTFAMQRAEAYAKELGKPDVAALNGEYPIYCSFADEGSPIEIHLLEILQGGRYQLIEWDCEAPDALRPLAALFEDERAPLP